MVLRSLICFPLLLGVGCSSSSTSAPILLGHPAPDPSRDESNGMALALTAIHGDAANLPMGRQLRILEADLGAGPEQAQGQAVRLATLHKVCALLGGQHSSFTDRLGLAAETENLLAIGTAGSSGASSPRSHLFTLGLSPKLQGEALAQFAEEQNWSTIALLRDPAAVVPGMAADAFMKRFGKGVLREFEVGKAADFAAASKELAFLQPSAILAVGTARNLFDWRSALTDQTNCPWIFCGEEAELASIPLPYRENPEILAACSFLVDSEQPESVEFARKYTEAYSSAPSIAAALAYDSVRIVSEAMRRANSTDADKVRQELLKPDASFAVSNGFLTFAADQTAQRRIYIAAIDRRGTTKRAAYPK